MLSCLFFKIKFLKNLIFVYLNHRVPLVLEMNYKVLNNLIYIFCILIIHHSKGGNLLHQIVSPVIRHILLSISHVKTCLATFTNHPIIHFFCIHFPHLSYSIVGSPIYKRVPISNLLADFFLQILDVPYKCRLQICSYIFSLFANSSESCKSLMIDQNSYMYKT